ncbi:BTAD domain-containing putative transcriptional regulator [Streptomyces sp. Da 82-17]|uniref:AfsR/SARP family transcriptional regulator n=1 Tax=Streptomyces sp. Da 82-17 TaxID=3377116 RepID=UPI0038D37D3F
MGRATTDDGTAVGLGHAKQRCVAAVLICAAGRAVPTERLIDRVWGEHPPPSARNVLYGYIARLRRVLRSAAAGRDCVRLVRGVDGYRLTLGPDQVDVHRFTRLTSAATAAFRAGDDVHGAQLLGEALELWRGSPLSGVSGQWAEARRTQLERDRLTARTDLAEAELRLGRHRTALPALRRLAAAHPLDERVARQLMTALYRDEQPAEALRQFEQTRRSLVEHLGTDPGPELAAAHRRILRNDPALLGDALPEPLNSPPPQAR